MYRKNLNIKLMFNENYITIKLTSKVFNFMLLPKMCKKTAVIVLYILYSRSYQMKFLACNVIYLNLRKPKNSTF